MTLNEYRKAYSNAQNDKDRAEAHARLVQAEQALAKRVAPIYYALMWTDRPKSLKETGEYDAYHQATMTLHV